MSLKVSPVSDVLGVEIRDLDLNEQIDDTSFDEINRLLLKYAVIVFRDQAELTPENHIAFSRRFGDLQIHVQRRFHLNGHPEILIISNVIENGEPKGLLDAGQYWHSDLSYVPTPSLGSLLHAKEVPPDDGDTIFVNMAAAFDALDPATKERLIGLTAVHDYQARNATQTAKSSNRPALDDAQRASVPPVEHPVVRVHPKTGRNALFVSEGFTTHIVGLPPEEGDALLQHLFAHSAEDRFQYRHRWRPHDLVFWDNRSTMHLATGCVPEKRRTLYRTTVAGDAPRAATSP